MQEAASEFHRQLLEPFIEAARTVLGEMAGSELDVAEPSNLTGQKSGEINAVIDFSASRIQSLILSFPQATAVALAKQILAENAKIPDDALVRDCLGEIANVIAGQAKAILAGTPYQFAFSLPRVVDHHSPKAPQKCLGVALKSNQGPLTLQLLLAD